MIKYIIIIYIIYLVLINIASFLLYFYDKVQHDKGHRSSHRIPKIILQLISVLGGCIGAYLVMFIYRHKLRHPGYHIANICGILIHTGMMIVLFVY